MTGVHDHRQAMASALEDVATQQVLRELHLRPTGDGSAFEGVIKIQQRRLTLDACQTWDAHWRLMGTGFSPRGDTALCDERLLPPSQPRGKTVAVVLDMWKALFGGDALAMPAVFLPGLLYAASKRTMAAISATAPLATVDGAVLRQTWKWLKSRFATDLLDGDGEDEPVTLQMENGLLRIEVAGQVYGCQARGVWAVRCTVRLGDWLSVPAHVRHGGWIRMAWTPGTVLVNGWSMNASIDENFCD